MYENKLILRNVFRDSRTKIIPNRLINLYVHIILLAEYIIQPLYYLPRKLSSTNSISIVPRNFEGLR